MTSDDAITELLGRGAQVQRPLWASTSTKNPTYDDLLYVDTIVADETVNTMPDATLADALDHANFAASVLLNDETASQDRRTAGRSCRPDVSLDKVTEQLEDDGVAAFAKSYEELLATVASKMTRTGDE